MILNKKENTILEENSGYAIVELLFYISIFAILILVVINAMIMMTRSFKETTVNAELIGSSSIMERMSREVKQASSISSISANSVVLNTKDLAGNPKTVGFSLSGSNIALSENGNSLGNLNTPNISVSALSFIEITTTMGKAIKMSLTLHSTNDVIGRNIDFYNTSVLRGSY
ncbi:MAG: hypothetical protein AAB945_00400 [Patescibacteria group bacterium]